MKLAGDRFGRVGVRGSYMAAIYVQPSIADGSPKTGSGLRQSRNKRSGPYRLLTR